LNKEVDVLVETYNDGKLCGYSSNYLHVSFSGDDSLINKIVKVKINKLIEKNNDYMMEGEIVNEIR
jgi:hypothetical protein